MKDQIYDQYYFVDFCTVLIGSYSYRIFFSSIRLAISSSQRRNPSFSVPGGQQRNSFARVPLLDVLIVVIAFSIEKRDVIGEKKGTDSG